MEKMSAPRIRLNIVIRLSIENSSAFMKKIDI